MLPPELLFSAQIYTKSFIGWRLAPYPTGGAHSAPADRLVDSGGGAPRERGGKGKERGERKGSVPMHIRSS